MDSIETPEALSAADPPPVMAAVPCPEAEAVPPPSDAPPLTIPLEPSTLPASVVFSPTSASASISPTQPQSQVPQQQRQTIAARTRSQNNHGQPSVSSPSSIPCSTSSSSSYPSIQRSGVAIGVPALHPHHNRPPSQAGYTIGSSSQFSQPFLGSSSPSQSFSQPFGGFPRGSVSLAEQSSSSTVSSSSFSQPFSAMSRSCAGKPEQQSISNSQFKPPVPGVQTIGMIGSLSSASRLPTGGIQPQQRLGQPIEKSIPQSGINQALNLQKFPNLGLSRPASMPSPNIPMPALQNAQSLQQQWMPNQAKQTHGTSFPSSSYRPQSKQHNSQQRPQSPQKQQQQHSPTVTPNQLQVSSSQKQEQQYHQQQQQQQKQLQQHQLQQHLQATRGASIPQRSNNQLGQPVLPHPGVTIPITEVTAETSNRILSKRSIQDLVAQIDPYEKLEPEVEDVLVEIADDFIESITTAACLLAKHRRSTTLEAKDILLHVERNWNFTLPGFGGDEVKLYKKPYTSDIHKERLAMIRKSMGITNDVGSTKNVGNAQVSINSKAHSNRASTAASASPKGM